MIYLLVAKSGRVIPPAFSDGGVGDKMRKGKLGREKKFFGHGDGTEVRFGIDVRSYTLSDMD